MAGNTLNAELHRTGGKDVPYEREHLTSQEHREATGYADFSKCGLVPVDIFDSLIWHAVPNYHWSYGKQGWKARSQDWLYIHTGLKWRRVRMDHNFNDDSSSSSASSSSSSSQSSVNSSESSSHSSNSSSTSSSSP